MAAPLAAALEDTWQRDPNLYYEDGFQLFAVPPKVKGMGTFSVRPFALVP